MAGETPLQEFVLIGLLILCASVVLFSAHAMRRRVGSRRQARMVVWTVVGAVFILFAVVYSIIPERGGVSISAGSARELSRH